MIQNATSNGAILRAQGISKSFSSVLVLEDVDLEIRCGEILCLIGENGAGKSTLMRILAGVIPADKGCIFFRDEPVTIDNVAKAQSMGISMIHQELNLVPSRTVAQNIYLGREPRKPGLAGRLGIVDVRRLHQEATQVLKRVGSKSSPETTLWDLTAGQQQLVEIAKALASNAQVLFMDEPTSSLSEETSENLLALIRELKAQGMAIVFTTHRLPEAFKVADRFVVLRDGKKVGEGVASELTQEKVVEWMVGRPMDQHYPKQSAKMGEAVLSVRGLCGGMVKDIEFTVHSGEILGFAGLVGAGRTEMARLIFGADKTEAGEIVLNGQAVHIHSPIEAVKLGIGFVPEDRKKDALVLHHSVRENMILAGLRKLSRFGVIRFDQVREAMDRYIARLDIRLRSPDQEVKRLSGGNQQKVVLCKWLVLSPKVLILDEPTRGIDVGAKATIYQLMGELANEGVALVFISSDLPEVLGMSDRIVVMSEGRIRATLDRAEATPEVVMQYASQGTN